VAHKHLKRSDRIATNGKLGSMIEAVVVVYFAVIVRYLAGSADRNYKIMITLYFSFLLNWLIS
jgi:hypothetical protein